MPIEVEELADVPIVILTFFDPLHMADLERAFVVVVQLADQGKPVYVVSDLSQLTVNMNAIMLGFNLAMRGVRGGPGDPRTTHIVTGKDGLVRQAIELIQRGPYNRTNIKHCATVDAGITLARSLFECGE